MIRRESTRLTGVSSSSGRHSVGGCFRLSFLHPSPPFPFRRLAARFARPERPWVGSAFVGVEVDDGFGRHALRADVRRRWFQFLPPDISASKIAGSLKGNSSFTVRRECKAELVGKLWGKAFWTPSYFVASCGGAPIEVIRCYVQQQGKAALKGGDSDPEGQS